MIEVSIQVGGGGVSGCAAKVGVGETYLSNMKKRRGREGEGAYIENLQARLP